jgi:hypothetical protein
MHLSSVRVISIVIATLSLPVVSAYAQDGGTTQPANTPAAAVQAQQDIEAAVERFGVGVVAGLGLDPELVMFGGHAQFGPIFNRNVSFRPGVELGIGEVTTMFGINLDVLYRLPGTTRSSRWMPYVGVGPTFGLSHRGFETDEGDKVTINGVTTTSATGTTSTTIQNSRFDFGDTDFEGGANFLAGARNQRGMFFELKATAWGVSNIRFLAGFNF